MAIQYKDLVPIGNGLIIAGVFFFLGVLAGNFPYDFLTLYTQNATEEAFQNSLRHYQTWFNAPRIAIHIMHAFLGLGFIGMGIKIYKPSDDAKYFEYGSLLLYVISICIYLTNLKTGAESAVVGEWGEVDWMTGINVIGASQAMIIFLLGGIIALQVGLYYAEWDYQQRLAAAALDDEKEKVKEKETPTPKPTAKSTATSATKSASTPVTKKTRSASKKA